MQQQSSSSSSTKACASLSKDEATIFDRGIRVWGSTAQMKLRNSRVAVLGSNNLAAEVCKNVALAGAVAVIIDSAEVSDTDIGAHLFVQQSDKGKQRAQVIAAAASNINRTVHAEAQPTPAAWTKDFFAPFTLVCAAGIPFAQLIEVSEACRAANVPLVAINAFGLSAWIFSDLIEFVPLPAKKPEEKTSGAEGKASGTQEKAPGTEEKASTEAKTSEPPAKRPRNEQLIASDAKPTGPEVFTSLRDALLVPSTADIFRKAPRSPLLLAISLLVKAAATPATPFADFLTVQLASCPQTKIAAVREIAQSLQGKETGLELAPVCAVIAGIASQEIIKRLTMGCPAPSGAASPRPINNVFVYESLSCVSSTIKL